MPAIKRINRISPFVKIVLFFLAGIGIVMVIRSLIVLSRPASNLNPSGNTPFDQGFSNHPVLILVHIIPGAIFMILGTIQFMPRIRALYTQFHRWSGRVFIMAAYIIGITAIVLPFVKHSIGGITEAVASIFFSILFLVCLSLSMHYIVRKKISLHREWMIRAFSIGLAISTIRLITAGMFVLFKISPQNFIGTAFWMGFTLHLLAAEGWINYTRKPFTMLYKATLLTDTNSDILK